MGVARLATDSARGGLPDVRCLAPMIMGLQGHMNRGVPTVFVHMPRDKRTAYDIEEDMAELELAGIAHRELRAEPKVVDADFLAPCLPRQAAEDLVAALRTAGRLDDRGLLKN